MKNKKAIFLLVVICALSMLFALVGCNNNDNSQSNVSVSIGNKDALAAVWTVGDEDRVVDFTVSDDKLKNLAVVSSSNSDAVTANGTTLKAVGAGKATVSVSVGNASDSVEITVIKGEDSGKARISMISDINGFERTEEGATISVVQDVFGECATIELPKVSAADAEGRPLATGEIDIETDLEVTEENGVKIVSAPKGTSTVVYKMADPNDKTKTLEQTVTINVYRRVFSNSGRKGVQYNYRVENELLPDAEQVVTHHTSLTNWAKFNLAPSKLYYAEVDFELPAYNKSNDKTNPVIGMAHFTKDTLEDQNSKFLASVIGRDSGNLFVKEITPTGNWGDNDNFYGGSSQAPLLKFINIGHSRGRYKLDDTYAFPANDTTDRTWLVKYAVARDNDYFYTFINGEYICAVAANGYSDKDTLPAIYGQRIIETSMKNIYFTGGADAQAKIDELLGANKENILKTNVLNDRLNLNTTYNNDGTVKEANRFFDAGYSEEKGLYINYKDKNQKAGGSNPANEVTPYVYLNGDFTVSYDYKPQDYDKGDALEHSAYLVIRNWVPREYWDDSAKTFKMFGVYSRQPIQFGAKFGADPAMSTVLLRGNEQDQNLTETLDYSEGVRFEIKRKLEADKAVYTLTAKSLKDNTVVTKTVEVTNENDTEWNQPVQILFRSVYIAGEFSNISWRLDK